MGLQPDNRVGDNGYYRLEANQLRTAFNGGLARHLGIHGQYTDGMDDRLFRGYAPNLDEHGHELKLVTRLDANRIGAVDWTFNRPKAVSALKLVAGDDRIDQVETRAEQAAMRYVEGQVRVRVRKKAEIEKSKESMPKGWKYPERKTGNLLYIPYRHPGSREGDPHSHTHYKIFNLSHDREENCIKSIEMRYVDRKGANEVYRRELRKGLAQLGYKTKADGQEFDVVGFPPEVKAVYSARHEGISGMEKEFAAKAKEFRKGKAVEKGISPEEAEKLADKPLSAKARAKLSVYDRPDKAPDVPLEDRKRGWVARITQEQFDGLRSLVAKAKSVVKRLKWREESRSAFDRMRGVTVEHDQQAPERERSNGRSR